MAAIHRLERFDNEILCSFIVPRGIARGMYAK